MRVLMCLFLVLRPINRVHGHEERGSKLTGYASLVINCHQWMTCVLLLSPGSNIAIIQFIVKSAPSIAIIG